MSTAPVLTGVMCSLLVKMVARGRFLAVWQHVNSQKVSFNLDFFTVSFRTANNYSRIISGYIDYYFGSKLKADK